MSSTFHSNPLRILFVNRMAGMIRGGGETFDLEMARHLAGLGCQITFLTGRPMIGKPLLGPKEWWGGETVESSRLKVQGEQDVLEAFSNIQRPTVNAQRLRDDDEGVDGSSRPRNILLRPLGYIGQDGQRSPVPQSPALGGSASSGQIAIQKSQISSQYKISTIFLHSPWLGWFPWDKVRSGWRVRLLDLWLFEWFTARWVLKHQDDYDVIQICELPELVKMLKQQQCRAKISMRLPGPQLYPGYGRGALEMVDLLIASGTSIAFYRERLKRAVVDVPNGVDIQQFKPELMDKTADEHGLTRIKLGGESAAETCMFSLICVARLTKIKNHRLLLRAVAAIKQKGISVNMRLVGSGPLRSDIEVMTKELGLQDQVLLMGEIPYEQMPDLYRSSDVAVVASDYESFGFVVLEAMACGLPVISTNVGIVPGLLGEDRLKIQGSRLKDDEINHGLAKMDMDGVVLPSTVPPKTDLSSAENLQPSNDFRLLPGGLVVPIGDERAMTQAIMWMVQHREERRAMSRWNRDEIVTGYGWDSSAKKLIGEYRRLVEQDYSKTDHY